MAASDDLKYRRRDGKTYTYPVLAGVKLYGRGATGLTSAGFAVPAGHASAVKLVGLARERVDNSGGANGAATVDIERGDVFLIPLVATVANIGAAVYASADDTFTLTAGSLLQIGTVHAVDASGTWLKIL